MIGATARRRERDLDVVRDRRNEVTSMSVYQRLESLSIKLPAVAPPVAALVPFVRSGWLVFLSGHSSARGRSIYTETIQAFNLGAPTLAEAGLRAIVEALCIHQGVSGNLQASCAAMSASRRIGSNRSAASGSTDPVQRLHPVSSRGIVPHLVAGPRDKDGNVPPGIPHATPARPDRSLRVDL
jgi:hypothetical protein